MDLQNTPDYIALHKSDAIDNNDVYSWNVPQSYFSSARGNKCYVSLVECVISDGNDGDLVVKYHGGANANNTKNDGSVIGTLCLSTSAANPKYSYNSAANVELLINARPSVITLSVSSIANATLGLTNAVFVLKFTYLDPENSNMDYSNTLYQKL